MVTSLDTALGSDDLGERAQLILVGAVAIAIIVMGLVVVFNTVLYVDNVAATGEVNAPGDAEAMSETINDSSRALIERVNAGPWMTEDEVEDAVSDNLSVYSDGLSNSTARSQSAVVSIDGPSASVYAARIEDTDGDEFTADGDRDWSVTTTKDTGVLVRDFDMIVDTNSLEEAQVGDSDDAFHIVWNATNTGGIYALWIYEESGSGDDVVVRTLARNDDDPPEFSDGTSCRLKGSGNTENDTVVLNISTGVIQGHPLCSQNLDVTEGVPIGTFSTVNFSNGDNASGRYSMVVWNDGITPSVDLNPPLGPDGVTDPPYWTYAMWETELVVSYNSGSLSYSDTFVIEVYNRTR